MILRDFMNAQSNFYPITFLAQSSFPPFCALAAVVNLLLFGAPIMRNGKMLEIYAQTIWMKISE